MRAIRFDEYGDYGVLNVVDAPEPQPGDGQMVVQMRAAAVNPFDNTVRRGWAEQVKPPMISGNEGTGIVVRPIDGYPEGTRVMLVGTFGFARDGTWQDRVLATAAEAVAVPDNLSDVEASATPVAYLAAQLALTHGVGLQSGMTLLIPGAGGSVGNAAIQLARIQGAGRVITSVGRTEKAKRAQELGIDDVIDLSQESLSAGVMRLTEGRGVDVALDTIGGPITGEALASLGAGGLLVQMGYPGGSTPTIDVMHLIWKPSRIAGFNMYFQPPEAFADAWATLLPLLADGRVKPTIDRTYPLEQAAEATRHLIEDRPFGKVVLTM